MRRHHLRTLQALFAHPLLHGVRVSQMKALCRAMGAEMGEREERRLHIRDRAGQRAPFDGEVLARITAALEDADAVLSHHLENHRRDLLDRIVGIETLDDGGMGEPAPELARG